MLRDSGPHTRRGSTRLAVACAIAASLVLAAPASADVLTVDDDGDQCILAGFSTIQDAVDAAAASGDEIQVCAGTYEEQVVVLGKELSIDSNGDDAVTVLAPPALSSGPCDLGGPVPVEAIICATSGAELTVQDLTVDGDGNGSANRFYGVFFRNAAGDVTDTAITDLRQTPFGASETGVGVGAMSDDATPRTVAVADNTIERFQFAGAQLGGPDLTATVSGNTIGGVGPQALLAQRGVEIGRASGSVTDNEISGLDYTGVAPICSSGVQLTQTPAGFEVSGNQLDQVECGIDAALGLGVSISDNAMVDARVAVSLFDTPATVSGNALDGRPDPDASGIFAAEGTTNADFTVTANANTLTGFNDAALELGDDAPDTFDASMDASFNRIVGNGDGARNEGGGDLTAEHNWWGCNEGPAGVGCDDVLNTGTGTADFDPWLVLGLSANPSTIAAGGASSQVTASLTRNSLGTPVGPGFPDGTEISFATTLGSIGGSATTSNGIATTTLTSGAQSGVANASGTLDNESVFAQVSITPAGTATADVAPAKKKKKCKKKKYREKHPNKCKKKKGK